MFANEIYNNKDKHCAVGIDDVKISRENKAEISLDNMK